MLPWHVRFVAFAVQAILRGPPTNRAMTTLRVRRTARWVAALSLTVTALVGSAALASSAFASPAGDLAAATNTARISAGFAPLTVNAQLSAVAQAWANKLAAAGALSHNPAFQTANHRLDRRWRERRHGRRHPDRASRIHGQPAPQGQHPRPSLHADGRWLRDLDLPVLRLPSALGRRRLPSTGHSPGRQSSRAATAPVAPKAPAVVKATVKVAVKAPVKVTPKVAPKVTAVTQPVTAPVSAPVAAPSRGAVSDSAAVTARGFGQPGLSRRPSQPHARLRDRLVAAAELTH